MKQGDRVYASGIVMSISEDGHANIALDGGVNVGLPVANLQNAMTAGKTASKKKPKTKTKK